MTENRSGVTIRPMAREVDAVGLIINEAIHTAFERDEFDQLANLARLQATYYGLLLEGLQPTPFESLSRPFRTKLGLEDVDPSKLSEVVYRTPIKNIPKIEDEKLRLIVRRINREFGGKLLDQSSIGCPDKDLPFWNELPPKYRNIVKSTVNTLKRNNKMNAGQVRSLSPEGLMRLREMGAVKVNIALGIYAPLKEVKHLTP